MFAVGDRVAFIIKEYYCRAQLTDLLVVKENLVDFFYKLQCVVTKVQNKAKKNSNSAINGHGRMNRQNRKFHY